jgi:hypothetical protein
MDRVNGRCRSLRAKPVTTLERIPAREGEFEKVEEPDESQL